MHCLDFVDCSYTIQELSTFVEDDMSARKNIYHYLQYHAVFCIELVISKLYFQFIILLVPYWSAQKTFWAGDARSNKDSYFIFHLVFPNYKCLLLFYMSQLKYLNDYHSGNVAVNFASTWSDFVMFSTSPSTNLIFHSTHINLSHHVNQWVDKSSVEGWIIHRLNEPAPMV